MRILIALLTLLPGAVLVEAATSTAPQPMTAEAEFWYAVASVKWLKRIDVLTEAFVGEFQTGHYIYEWADQPHETVTFMRVRARMTDPPPGSTIRAGKYTLRGKAWSGTGPVTRVDISFTGAGDWHPAQLEPPRGPYQWQDWSSPRQIRASYWRCRPEGA